MTQAPVTPVVLYLTILLLCFVFHVKAVWFLQVFFFDAFFFCLVMHLFVHAELGSGWSHRSHGKRLQKQNSQKKYRCFKTISLCGN